MTDGSLNSVARPGAIISQLWPLADQRPGESLHGIAALADEDFFEAVLASPMGEASERREVAALIGERDIKLTYGMIPLITAQGWSLSTGDDELRARSIAAIQQRCDEAREAGAIGIMVSPGPAPASEPERQQALARLTESLQAICAAAPDLRVMIEPLDVLAHKKQALGYTPEAIELARTVIEGGGNFALCLDTAHMALNEEDVAAALTAGSPYASTWHFCNAVTTLGHEQYGDHHPPLGAPGYLDLAGMADLLALGREIGFFGTQRREVMIEEFNHAMDDFDAGIAIMRTARENLTAAWEQANS